MTWHVNIVHEMVVRPDRHTPYLVPSHSRFGEFREPFRVILLDSGPTVQRNKTATKKAKARYLSFQKLRSSSMVLEAPRILANKTSTPASFGPQKALQKSRYRAEGSGEPSLAYFEREVVDACRLADMADGRALWATASTLNHEPAISDNMMTKHSRTAGARRRGRPTRESCRHHAT